MGVLYLVYLPIMMMLHANDYYLAPVYPLLFAAGGMAWDQWLRAEWARRIAIPVYFCLLIGFGTLTILSTEAVLTPPEYVRYIGSSGLRPNDFNHAVHVYLPELPADMTGWQDMADKLAGAYLSLPSADRAKAGILVSNYGEASAVNVYRPDVPAAISGNVNYWYWGPRGHNGSVMVVFGQDREVLEKQFASVTEVARTTNKWGHASEIMPIFVCRNARQDLRKAWPSLKRW
jgi:hypothetical protein